MADRELWFHTEISNVVLSAWNKYPAVAQMSYPKPQGLTNPADEVPIAYSMQCGSITAVLAVGEIKKNAIDRVAWQSGNLGVGQMHAAQRRLSQELRGYVAPISPVQVVYVPRKLIRPSSSVTLASFNARKSSASTGRSFSCFNSEPRGLKICSPTTAPSTAGCFP